ncbi:hypothetical protein [Actinoplanes sp. TFC3]|uniref:hypothetical protein n=1 Tax=Actinoplanes sp. TFC3 TaxID=1710355 RepID=UPI000A908F2E|nr:hypothetical protein [Actinoplanes sp. TFC3]
MSARSGPRTVTTRYVWLPHGRTGGWLLVHRSISRSAKDVTHDFWITGEIAPEDASDVLKDSTADWAPLVLGEQINFLLWPYVLTAVTGKQLRRVREQLLLAPVRPLADITVSVADGPDGPRATEPSIMLADDPYAPEHEDLDLAGHWSTGALDASTRRAELLTAVSSRTGSPEPLRRMVQVNRFVTQDVLAGTALGDVLARRAVRTATAALLADPAAEEARERLVDELRGHGWRFDSVPITLQDTPKPGFLERLVFFLADQGPEHQATYRIATLPTCADLLDTPGLAQALADHLGPLDPSLRSDPAKFRAALTELPPEWDPPRERGVHLAPPDTDEITTVAGPSPVSIGAPPTGDPRFPHIAEIHHIELFDSRGVAQGTYNLSRPV